MEITVIAERARREVPSVAVMELCDVVLELAATVTTLERRLIEARAANPKPRVSALAVPVEGYPTLGGERVADAGVTEPKRANETRSEYMKRWRKGQGIQKRSKAKDARP